MKKKTKERGVDKEKRESKKKIEDKESLPSKTCTSPNVVTRNRKEPEGGLKPKKKISRRELRRLRRLASVQSRPVLKNGFTSLLLGEMRKRMSTNGSSKNKRTRGVEGREGRKKRRDPLNSDP